MSVDMVRALARGTAIAVIMAGLAVAGGQYGGWDVLYLPLWVFASMTGVEYWWRRRARARVALAAPVARTPSPVSVGKLGLVVLFGCGLMCGVLAWRGQLRPESFVIVAVSVLLAVGAAWGLEVVARRREAAAGTST